MIRWASLPASGLKLNTNVAFREKHGFIKTAAVTRNEWGVVLATSQRKQWDSMTWRCEGNSFV